MITFINVFPKSGTGMIINLRGIYPDLHISLYNHNKPGYKTPGKYAEEIGMRKRDFTGHIPYSETVHQALLNRNMRIVFIYRDLRDVVISLAHYVRKNGNRTEFNVYLDVGYMLYNSEDLIADCIKLVGEWWRDFSPWLKACHASYTYEELRPAAFLRGGESHIGTFYQGKVGTWRDYFRPEHIKLAEEFLPEVPR